MNEERIQYVGDLLDVMPNHPIQLSFWGKDSAEKLVAQHRLATAELLGYGATGATGGRGLKVGLALMGRLGTPELLRLVLL